MRTAIDGFGRILIPRPLREQAALRAGTELDVRCEDGRLVIEPAPMAARVRKAGMFYVAEALNPVATLESARVERELEALRSSWEAPQPIPIDERTNKQPKRKRSARKRGKR
jgi:AbrB family looped-hinge helix DNA binding protein